MSKERYELRYVGDWYCYVYDNEQQQGADICSLDDSVRIFNEQDKKIKDLETKLADMEQEQIKEMQEHQEAMKLADKTIKATEEQNKRVLEKLELIVRANQELEQKLAESFTEKDVEGLIKDREETIKFLKQQLAEKDKEIEMLNDNWNVLCDYLGDCVIKYDEEDVNGIYREVLDKVNILKRYDYKRHQDKISFALEQLEKVKENIIDRLADIDRQFMEDLWDEEQYARMCWENWDTEKFIDNQINVLRNNKDGIH